MNPDNHNRKSVFLIFMLVAVLGYFGLPRIQQYVPPIEGKSLAELDAIVIPNEVTVLSEREILSQIRTAVPEPPSYLVCSIDDDPEGTNAYGIYDPTDLAVTVSNLVRLNTKHLFLGTHLHWPDLPPIENNTLNSQLELLDSCILSTPLRRTADAVDIPQYLLDSSVALEKVKGNTLTLPRVNNLSLAPTLKIPNNCEVGFSQLESEPETSKIPLLAVWGERVILSSLLLERIHHLELEVKDIEITIGKFISLGDTGNVIPIDEFGYFTPSHMQEVAMPHVISADITSVKESPVETENAVLTAAGAKADNYRAIESPVKQLTQLTLTPVFRDTVHYTRVWWWAELIAAVVVGLLLVLAVKRLVVVFWLWAMGLGCGLFYGSRYLSAETIYFAPIIYLLIAIVVCMVIFPFLKHRANYIHSVIAKPEDLGDLSVLYQEEVFPERELTAAKISAHDRKRRRKKTRRELRNNKKLKKDNSELENT